jgi:putative hemolysin
MSILTGIFSGDNIKSSLVKLLPNLPWLEPYKNSTATVIVVVCITYLSLVSELTAKRIGLSRPEAISKWVSTPMQLLSKVAHPFVWLLSKSTNLISNLFRIKPNDTHVTEEEIKAIINEGTETGAIEETEQEIIERVFHLGDRNITSLMTHRSDIVWMDVNCKVADIKQKMREVVHTTYPLCEGVIDNIKGIVSIKDILLASDHIMLKDLMKPGLFVPENNSVYQVLEKFKELQANSCFIVDEYGSVEGMMTLNDILEAIVGDIGPTDEDAYEMTEREDGSYLVDAQVPFYDFLSKFEKTEFMNEGEHDFNTLAGFILHQLRTIPETGETLEWKGFRLEIIDMDRNRIDKVLVTLSEEMKTELEENA